MWHAMTLIDQSLSCHIPTNVIGLLNLKANFNFQFLLIVNIENYVWGAIAANFLNC
jgi:hypothetical protein